MIYDSQDRQFRGYEDAYWYNEDVLVYEELNPNMPKKAVSIYNVPDDAEGYYMVIGKAGTIEICIAFRYTKSYNCYSTDGGSNYGE